MFHNKTTAEGTTVEKSFTLSDPGLVPFLFKTLGGGGLEAVNGGPIAAGVRIAFALIGSDVVYALFDDGGAGPDADFDDMVVKITGVLTPGVGEVPIPGAALLFGSGLVGLTVLARRRRMKRVAARMI
jgi:hypothetical protein